MKMTPDELAALERAAAHCDKTVGLLDLMLSRRPGSTFDASDKATRDEAKADAATIRNIIARYREKAADERSQIVAAEQRAAKAERLVRMRDRQIEQSARYWCRVGDRALAGDMGPLRNRIQMHREPPLEVSLSGAHLPGPEAAECPTSPTGRHIVDTSMESGPNNCFHCEKRMG